MVIIKKGQKYGMIVVFAMLIVLMFTVPVSAAKYKSQWRNVKGKYYYWNDQGVKVKGLQMIGGKYYYFDSRCVQRTGWRKVKGDYYYFQKSNGKKGYMRTSTTIDGVKLKKNGKATLTKRSRRKLAIMVKCSSVIDSLTNANQTKAQKLKIAFEYAKNHYGAVNIGGFKSGGDWDMYYAERMLNYGRGDCYCYGAIFGYLANAVGYSNVKVASSGGHGWTEIGGRFYDPNWARVIGTSKCYAVPASLSGAGGRPNWARYGIYKKNLSK